jgi:hypothetical protein
MAIKPNPRACSICSQLLGWNESATDYCYHQRLKDHAKNGGIYSDLRYLVNQQVSKQGKITRSSLTIQPGIVWQSTIDTEQVSEHVMTHKRATNRNGRSDCLVWKRFSHLVCSPGLITPYCERLIGIIGTLNGTQFGTRTIGAFT